MSGITDREAFNCYYDGMEAGVELYAHWRDGIRYVGTTGKTLEQAYQDIEAERQLALMNYTM
jgi:hypothetical protein